MKFSVICQIGLK